MVGVVELEFCHEGEVEDLLPPWRSVIESVLLIVLYESAIGSAGAGGIVEVAIVPPVEKDCTKQTGRRGRDRSQNTQGYIRGEVKRSKVINCGMEVDGV